MGLGRMIEIDAESDGDRGNEVAASWAKRGVVAVVCGLGRLEL